MATASVPDLTKLVYLVISKLILDYNIQNVSLNLSPSCDIGNVTVILKTEDF